jgi:LPS export ABC transporter permease LptG/LPS export ABC transporter permease LptF
MLRTLDRYIIKETLAPFGLTLLILTFVLQIPTIMQEAERLLAKGVSLPIIGRILVTLLPQSLALTIPIALLIGLLMALGRLSGDREAVAMQACGVSLYRMLRPVALLATVGAAVTAWVLIEALPRGNRSYRDIVYSIVQAKAESDIRPRVFFEDFPNLVLFVRDVPIDGSGWRQVFLADSRDPAEPRILTAERGHFVLEPDVPRVDLILENGVVHRSTPETPDDYELQQFSSLTVQLDPEAVFPRQGVLPGDNELTIAELREKANRMRAEGLSPHNPIMTIHKKYSIPVACFVFGLLALGLGVSHRKDGKSSSFVVGIGVVLIYYFFMYLGDAMAKGQRIPAEWAMWIPNIVLGAAGVVLLLVKASGRELAPAITLPYPAALERWVGAGRRLVRRSAGTPAVGGPAAPRGAAGPSTPRDPHARGRSGQVVIVIRIPQGLLPSFTLIDRYISRVYLRVFAVTFLGMLALFYIGMFTDYSEYLFKNRTTAATMAKFFAYSTPQYAYYITALAALVGGLVTIGLLTRTSELTVLEACGVSLYRAGLPLVVFGVLWSVALFGMEQSVLAPANRQAEILRSTIRSGVPRTFNVSTRQWMAGSDDRLYQYGRFDAGDGRLDQLTIYDFDADGWSLQQRTFGRVVQHTTAGAWQADQGWRRSFGAANTVTAYAPFDQAALTLEPADYFGVEEPEAAQAERLKLGQLRNHIAELQLAGYDTTALTVALHRKMAFPFITVIMTLIAIPFGVTTGRRGTLFGIGVGIILAILYWMTQSFFAAMGSAGVLGPAVAAWAPNVLFAAVAVYLLLTART